MAQGAWDTGTWDAALWDSLPVTGNSATGSPGSVGTATTASLAGTSAASAVGAVAATVTVSLSGVQATGQIGTEGEVTTVPISGAEATGAAGNVGLVVTVALSGNSASGQVGDVAFVPQPILLIDDTHDGRRFKEQLERDKKLRKKQKQQILDAFERIVEGRPEIAEEIAAPYVVTRPKTKAAPIKQTINFDALFADLDRVQRIWETHLEMDDEDVLTLL